MEFACNHESVCINEVVFDGNLEQSVELDHLLPDYCPNIFKILKCKLIPKITSRRIEDNKLYLEAIVYIKILYVAEETNEIRLIEQKVIFSKTADLRVNVENPIIRTTAKCDYVNCRVVNPKRLDIRGAVSIHCHVTDQKTEEILSNACGNGIQLQKQSLSVSGMKKCVSKQFTVREEFEIGAGKPVIGNILSHDAVCMVTDVRLIANKVICKGEAILHTLYLPEGGTKPELLENSILLGQIIDLPGVDEDFSCNVDIKTDDVMIELKEDAAGENRILSVELAVTANCTADRNRELQLVSDLFSTCYESEANGKSARLEKLLAIVNETTICKHTLDFPNDQIECIYDLKCDFEPTAVGFEKGEILLSGNLNIEILALDHEQIPCVLERTIPCRYEIASPLADEAAAFRYDTCVVSAGYSMLGPDQMELRVEIRTSGCLYESIHCDIITAVRLDEDKPKVRTDEAALKLYFADEGEAIWEIAKRYNTSVSSIIADNSLTGDKIEKRGMILIPIVD